MEVEGREVEMYLLSQTGESKAVREERKGLTIPACRLRRSGQAAWSIYLVDVYQWFLHELHNGCLL